MIGIKNLILTIAMVAMLSGGLQPHVAMAQKPPMSLVLLGTHVAPGPRAGLGISGGVARATCGDLGCQGYGLLLGHRFGLYQTTFLEAGAGFFLMYVAAYAGLGVRAKDGRMVGGQISLGLGGGPILPTLTAYTEDKRLLGEFSLSVLLPIPFKNK